MYEKSITLLVRRVTFHLDVREENLDPSLAPSRTMVVSNTTFTTIH